MTSEPRATPASSSERSRTCERTPGWSSTTRSRSGSTGWATTRRSTSRRSAPRRSRSRSIARRRRPGRRPVRWRSPARRSPSGCARPRRLGRDRRPADASRVMTAMPGPARESGPGPAAPLTGRSARFPARWAVFVEIAVVVAADQAAKAAVTAALAPGQSVAIVDDLLRIVFGQNTGALFGLFKDNAVMFGIVSLIVIALIVAYHARATPSFYLTITLGL